MKTYKMKINGNEYEVAIQDVNGQNVEVEVNGKAYTVELDQPARAERPKPVIARPTAPTATTVASPASQQNEVHAEGATKSPLPGTILSINVTVGQSVKAGDVAIVRWSDCQGVARMAQEPTQVHRSAPHQQHR